MALTRSQRTKLLEKIVTNCDKMKDEDLQTLADASEGDEEDEENSPIEEGNELAEGEEELPVENEDEEEKEEEESEEEEDEEKKPAFLTQNRQYQEFLRDQQSRKVKLVAKLTANLSGAKKTAAVNRLSKLDLEDLKLAANAARPVANYSGAEGLAPVGNAAVDKIGEASALVPQTIDWSQGGR